MLGLSVLGLLFYYLMWLITDEEFREMLKYGWPWTCGLCRLLPVYHGGNAVLLAVKGEG